VVRGSTVKRSGRKEKVKETDVSEVGSRGVSGKNTKF